jgi:hypothetical protein
MSNESGENEIDDLFKNAIEPVNTEPSERFWQNAAEDVISRGSKLNQKNTSRWRAIAFILAAGLLTLGYFSYKMETQLKTVEKQVRTIENVQTSGIKTGNTNSTENAALDKVNNSASIMPGNTNGSKQNKSSTNITQVESSGQRGLIKARSSLPAKQNKTRTSAAVVFDIESHPDKQYKKPVNPVTDNTNDKVASSIGENQSNNSTKNENITNALTSNESLSFPPKLTKIDSVSIKNRPEYVLKQTQGIMNDTIKAVQLLTDTNPSKFSISAFFSPNFMVGYKFKTSSSWDNQIENTIKTGEKQNFSYTVGAKAEYNLSSRFAISAGIAYQVYSFTSKPGIIYAQKQSGGDVGYYLTTSSGVVECPSYYGTPNIGDSIRMSAASTRTYLEIPVRLKYNFVNKKKLKLYFIAGADANICLAEKTTMDWQDFWNESGVANINETEGSERVYMSCYLGIGVNFKICNNLSLYLEPGMHRAITALDNDISPVVAYPQLFSATAGLTYHIK